MADKRIRVGRPEEKFIYIDKSVGKLLPAAGGLMCKKRGRSLSFPERQNGLVLLIFSGTPGASCRSVP